MKMTFQDFEFDEKILKSIDAAGFKEPMPVQAETFHLLFQENRDIYAQSQTGTGKTAAFLLGIYQLFLKEKEKSSQKALIVVPTRELAVQIEAEALLLGKNLDFSVGSIFGGVGYAQQESLLEKGLDIIIATPGRLLDFQKKGKINFHDFTVLVIDEADRLFDMGFLPSLRKIFSLMRPTKERRTMLFSATLNPRVGNLAWEHMNDPGDIIIEPEKIIVDTVSQGLYHVGAQEKMPLLLGLLKRDQPDNAVIFTNTRHKAWEVAERLKVNGYKVEFLMGDLPQNRRLKIVEDVKNGKVSFLVATDVAARGLHINDLKMVINYDVPLDAESYVHRIGRTARVGQEGTTLTLACEEYVYGLSAIEKLLGHKIPILWSDESLPVEDKSAGMRFSSTERYRDLGKDTPRRRNEAPRNKGNRYTGQKRKIPVSSHQKSAELPRNTKNQSSLLPSKKSLDPRASMIQSAVSSVAGTDLPEFAEKPRRQVRLSSSPRRGKKRSDNSKKSRVFEEKRVGVESSMDERLAFYSRKFGENFESKEGVKKSSRSTKRTKKSFSSKNKAATPRSEGKKNPSKENREYSSQTTKQEKKKKGIFQRLFGNS